MKHLNKEARHLVRKTPKSKYRYYADLVSGKIIKVLTKDIKIGNPIWHIGDTHATFREAVLLMEREIKQDLEFHRNRLRESQNYVQSDIMTLERVKKLKKDKRYKK